MIASSHSNGYHATVKAHQATLDGANTPPAWAVYVSRSDLNCFTLSLPLCLSRLLPSEVDCVYVQATEGSVVHSAELEEV